MSNSELYTGVPNAVILCFDEPIRQGLFRGRMYHAFHEGAYEVVSFEEVIHLMGRLFDDIQFPRANIRDRSFFAKEQPEGQKGRSGKEKIMADKELLSKHGDIATFIVRVQQRQNSSWQGRVTWVDENKTVTFRSILELIKLIESGVATNDPEAAVEDSPDWED